MALAVACGWFDTETSLAAQNQHR